MRKLKLKGKRRQVNDKMCFILCWNVYTVSAILGLHMCVDCGQATVLYTQQRTKHFSRFKWKIRYFEIRSLYCFNNNNIKKGHNVFFVEMLHAERHTTYACTVHINI